MTNKENEKEQILYLCDRRNCKNCSYPVCKHTLDITHAVNFISEAGSFKEIEKTTININPFKTFIEVLSNDKKL